MCTRELQCDALNPKTSSVHRTHVPRLHRTHVPRTSSVHRTHVPRCLVYNERAASQQLTPVAHVKKREYDIRGRDTVPHEAALYKHWFELPVNTRTVLFSRAIARA
jgi:hypothetical protein